jgi:hypothetical protein
MIVLIVAAMVMIVAKGARAGELEGRARGEDVKKWTAMDTSLEITYGAFHVMDWTQTLHLSRNPNGLHELNTIMGRNPSEGRVNSYFAMTLAGHAAVAYMLPKPWRTIWQSVWIGIEYDVVRQNREAGLGISLHF